MATWQQGINSGGFLAGIGTQNENAPKAYESPVIRNALLRLANTPKGSTAYDRAISTVTQSLTRVAQASQKESQ
ncbi:TPA: hypothetical protein GF684_22155 [Escherichia coli]|nr:hypothetical protein [Escherichia coli]RCP96292.1 hypothetical protein APT18_11730 [Escherichia coli]HAH2800875.1 hypothetical protein [Escherichia coli]HAH2803386.1 hypothetical protein [Escherichia coli]HAI0817524.1 hypothetical protein [Escherichia coli]HAI0820118.1 hypothetical protein [Escherichia coli]